MEGEIVLVGIGDGEQDLTLRAINEIKTADVVSGFEGFVKQVEKYFSQTCEVIQDQKLREQVDCNEDLQLLRAKIVVAEALKGKKVINLYGGDLGIYTPAFYMFDVGAKNDFHNIRCVPGLPHFIAAASKTGTPIEHGFALTSLFDRRTAEEYALKRIEYAAMADYVIIVYVPVPESTIFAEMYPIDLYPNMYPIREKAQGRFIKMYDILCKHFKPETLVAIIRNTSATSKLELDSSLSFLNAGEEVSIIQLKDLLKHYDSLDYLSTLIIGSSKTIISGKNRLITTFPDGEIYKKWI